MSNKIKRVIYPGTFDPVTNGHLDIIKRAADLFDEVVVAVSVSKDKAPMFDLTERVHMMQMALRDIPNAVVKPFDSLLVAFANSENSNIIIRGLRAVSDFEYELQIGYANRALKNDIDTIYLMPSLEYAFISSSIVRSVLKYEGDISHLVPEDIATFIYENKGGTCTLP